MVYVMSFITHRTLQTYAAMWIIESALLIHWIGQPYVWNSISMLEALSLSCIAVTLNCSLLFDYRTKKELDDESTKTGMSEGQFYALSAFVLLINVITMLVLAIFVYKGIKEKLLHQANRVNKLLGFLHLPLLPEDQVLKQDEEEYEKAVKKELQEIERSNRKFSLSMSFRRKLGNLEDKIEEVAENAYKDVVEVAHKFIVDHDEVDPLATSHHINNIYNEINVIKSQTAFAKENEAELVSQLLVAEQETKRLMSQLPEHLLLGTEEDATDTLECTSDVDSPRDIVKKLPIFTFYNGDSYDGEWMNEMMHGKGTYRYTNGDWYEGQYELHQKHGYGTFVYADGMSYQGHYVRGAKCGKGTTIYPNGDSYVGDFKDNEFNGNGIFNYICGDRYEGQWKDGVPHGFGERKFADGSIYRGSWEDGKRNGAGSYITEGCTFQGEWKDGLMHGKGRQTFSDSSKYQGHFANGMRNGFGVLTEVDGSRYEGEWKDNQRQGKATFYYPSGDKCEGLWQNNEMHGDAVFTTQAGKRYKVTYVNNTCVKKELLQ
eukprot:NODE_1333_length_2007_cov_63.397028_g1127_i0.p1 GENE.NODE_1333_length_2007_cov_63.397028_g1127_i0~~NODE_1333_length_2007_cov_63.397028_g1127_i0.p1  ORF type:complete len:630 (+),score=115.59 NODE_1333_length_2007_cov_63.397028_g1127_i0:256-1890(+)